MGRAIGVIAGFAALTAGVGAVGASALDLRTSASVNVSEKEWVVKPTPVSARAGKVTFVVRNAGKLSHEFVVLRTATPAAKLPVRGGKAVLKGKVGQIGPFKPGQSRRLTLTLKAGKYVLLCNLPGHYQAGQRGSFKVG